MNIIRKVVELNETFNLLTASGGVTDSLSLFVSGINARMNVWAEQGSKTFILSKDLIEAFKYTDVPMDSYPKDFQYPFPAFMIEGEVPLFTTKTPLGVRDIYCILYVSDEAAYKTNTRFITMDGKPTDKLDWSKGLMAFFTVGPIGTLEYIQLNMRDDCTIGTAANTRSPNTNLDADLDDTRNLVNIFYNTIMYVNDPSRDKKQTESIESRKFKIAAKGPAVKSSCIHLRAPRDYISLSPHIKTGILDHRIIVRGHWRQQAYGEKLSLRKRLWIKPYYKGPELAPVQNKPYKVD